MKEELLFAQLSYAWKAFTLDGIHLAFAQHKSSRLEKARCSHWGPAVYKWEGILNSGPNADKTGVLIGETGNIRQRIKNYVSGPQKSGNKLWREIFLSLGEIRLYTLDILQLYIGEGSDKVAITAAKALSSNNMRLVLEQLLISREVARRDKSIWIVNARQ